MKKVLALVLAVIGADTIGVAQADIFAGGPVYSGSPATGASITCRVFNAGTAPVTITIRQIFDNTDVSYVPVNDTCNVALNPKKTCFYSIQSPGNLAFSCRLITSGTTDNLRGTVEMFSSPTQFFELPITK